MLSASVPTEAQEAHTLVAWLQIQGLKFHHSPNETGHSMEARRRAVRVKREGTSAGFPDYLVLIPPARSITGEGFCLLVELKRIKGGTVSEAQRGWIDALNSLDVAPVAAYVARGAEEAINIVSRHIGNDSRPRPF